jgi:curli biogenesis system outer membrane secretion channel CsgG
VQEPPGDDQGVEKSASIKKPGEKFLKRKVAIARFSNETQHGKGLFGTNSPSLGKKAKDILSAKLSSTNKFIFLERFNESKVKSELKKDNTNLSDAGLSANYLIVGSISEFGRRTTGESGPFSRSKTQTARAGVNVRIIDAHTNEVIFSEEATAKASSQAYSTLGAGSASGYNSALNDKAIAAAISKLVSDLVENMTDRPWRSYILFKQDDSYLIAGGKNQGIEKGDTFGVFKEGEKVENPQTGRTIQMQGDRVATLKVEGFTESQNGEELSICTVKNGSISDQEDYSSYYIEDVKEE